MAVSPKAFEMEFDGFTNQSFSFFYRCAGDHTSGQVWNIGRVV